MSMVTSTPLTDAAGYEAEAETVGVAEPDDGPHFGGVEEENLCVAGCYVIVDTGTSGQCSGAILRWSKIAGSLLRRPPRGEDLCTGRRLV